MTMDRRSRRSLVLSGLVVAAAWSGIASPVHSALSDRALVATGTDSVWLAGLGFYHRRASGLALLAITGDELGSQREMLERFRGIEGVDVVMGRYGREFRLRQEDGACEPDLFLNGSRVQRRGAQGSLWFLDLLRPHEIDGIELYRGSEAPIGHPEECGAFLVWSKYRAGRDPVDFSGVLYSRVRDSNGTPLRDCVVVVEPGGHTDRTDAQGLVTFGRIMPGLVSVRAGRGDAGLMDLIEVRASGRTEVEIILDDCAS